MSACGKTIAFLRECAVAPAHQLPHFARTADQLPRVPVGEAGDCGAMLAAVARGAVRQMQYANPQTQIHLRDAIAKLSEALMSELEAHGGDTLPYYNRV